MPQHGALGPAWREILDKHQTALAGDLATLLAADVSEAVSATLIEERAQTGRRMAQACEEARRSQSETLNQSLRRLRLAGSDRTALHLLSETCAPWAARCVVLTFSAEDDAGARVGGLAGYGLAGIAPEDLDFPLALAPAVAAALESREPLIAIASGEQISPPLSAAFGGDAEGDGYGKAYLFPLVVRQSPVAVLVASGEVEPAQVELLCEAAAMRLESLVPAGGLRTSESRPSNLAWDDLLPDDQSLHLQAQRMARVRAAELRLHEEDAFRRGRAAGDLYAALQPRIDAARREFLQNYLSRSSTMVDYLHLEMLRTLAGGDASLFGAGYPGPLV